MIALSFSEKGSLDGLSFVERAAPSPATGEVLVAVRAAGLNPSDVKNVLGMFPYTTLPRVPGRDFAGVVEAGPAELVGRAVWGTGRPLGFLADGAHAEKLVVAADGVAPLPRALSFEQAASCGVPYVTAWDGLSRARVGRGTRLLIIGGNGAVGQAALGLGQALGAEVLAAVRRPEQLETLRQQGQATVLLAKPEDLAEAVRRHFGVLADVIYDTTGNWLPASVGALADNGHIIVIAPPSMKQIDVEFPVLAFYRRGGTLLGVNTLLHDTVASARMLVAIGELFDSGRLRLPHAARIVPFAQACEAYRLVNEGASEKFVFAMS